MLPRLVSCQPGGAEFELNTSLSNRVNPRPVRANSFLITALCSPENIEVRSAWTRSARADRPTQFAETAAMDDGRFAGPPAGAVRACLHGFLGLDQRDRRPGNRALARCRARARAESVRDHRPQPVGNRRNHPRHSRRRHHLARGDAAPAAEAARRFAAAGEIDLDFRRQGPRAGQQPGGAGARHRFFGPGLFQGPCRRRYRDLHRRSADAAAALSGRAVLRRQPAAAERGRQFRRRDPGIGAAGIFREFLRPDRPRARQLLCARPDRRHGAGPLSDRRPRASPRPQRAGRTKDRGEPQGPASSPSLRRPTASNAASDISGSPNIRSISAPASRRRRYARAGSPP